MKVLWGTQNIPNNCSTTCRSSVTVFYRIILCTCKHVVAYYLCMTAVDRALQTFMRGHLGVNHAHAFNKESVFGCFKNMIWPFHLLQHALIH